MYEFSQLIFVRRLSLNIGQIPDSDTIVQVLYFLICIALLR